MLLKGISDCMFISGLCCFISLIFFLYRIIYVRLLFVEFEQFHILLMNLNVFVYLIVYVTVCPVLVQLMAPPGNSSS